MTTPPNPKRNSTSGISHLPLISGLLAIFSLAAYVYHRVTKSKAKGTETGLTVLPAILSGGMFLTYLVSRRRQSTQDTQAVASTDPVTLPETSIAATTEVTSPSRMEAPNVAASITQASAPPPTAPVSIAPPVPNLPYVPAKTLPNVKATPAVRPTITRTRTAIAAILILCGLALFGWAQYVLNISQWLATDPMVPDILRAASCPTPQFCELRFLPFALVAFVAIALAMILFGIVFYYLRVQWTLPEPAAASIHLRKLNAKVGWQTLVSLTIVLLTGYYIVSQGINRQPILTSVWLVQLAAFIWFVWTLSGENLTHNRLTQSPTLWNFIYLAGIAALLVAVAAIVAPKPLLAVIAGVAAVILLGSHFRSGWPHWETAKRAERILLPLIAVAGLCLYIYGVRDWNWAVSQDELHFWDFYEQALFYATGAAPWPHVNTAGVYNATSALNSALQAVSMLLFGADVYGWKVSNMLLQAMSIPALYYVARQYQGRRGALLAGCLYCSGYFILSYSKTGSHSAQIVPAFVFTLAAFIWATRQNSLIAYALAGIVMGADFYTYGVARIYAWVVAVWLLLYCFPINLRARKLEWSRVVTWAVVGGAIVLTAMPSLLDSAGWEEQWKRTIIVQSDTGAQSTALIIPFFINVAYGFTSFITNSANTTFVYGAHTDPISASLIIIAIVALIVTWRQGWHIRAFLLAMSIGLTFFIGSLHTYSYPSNYWMYALTPLYALLAALGLQALGKLIQSLVTKEPAFAWLSHQATPWVVTVLAIGIIVPINIWLSFDFSQRKLVQSPLNFMVQTAQLTTASDGSGAHVFAIINPNIDGVYLTDKQNPFLPLLFSAFNVPPERLTQLSAVDALNSDDFCRMASEPAVAILDAHETGIDNVILKVQQCWPGAISTRVQDITGRMLFFRIMNAGAQSLVHLVPGYWLEEEIPRLSENQESPLTRGKWEVDQPLGIAISPKGNSVIIEGGTGQLVFFDPSGQVISTVGGAFVYPSAVGYTSQGQLVVLDAGAPQPLTWFDDTYASVRGAKDMLSPRGMFIAPDDSIYVADTGQLRVVHLDANGELLQEYRLADHFGQPTSVAVSPSGQIAIGDPVAGKVFILSSPGELEAEYPVSVGGTTADKPGLLWLADNSLLYTDPGNNKMLWLRDGEVVQEWTDLDHPNGLALTTDGNLLVLEYGARRATEIPFAGTSP